MIMMKAKHMLPLLALSVASAYAGDRETFDFGWKFKYCGSGDPAEAGVPVYADSHQGTHSAAYAVDGDLMTRWCAKDQYDGHYLVIRPGFKDPVKMAVIYWEQRNNLTAIVSIDHGGSETQQIINVGHQAASFIDLGGKPVKSIKIRVGGTHIASWASIREVMFTGMDNQPLHVHRRINTSTGIYNYYIGKIIQFRQGLHYIKNLISCHIC